MLPIDRRAFRTHPLDGAALFFQPVTGVHVRIATPLTKSWRRRAPRVAMFGITNACNLACEFCSRDTERASTWTVATAAEALSGLASAGTLEVAYGGGEPFAFRGFSELVAELDHTTTLAQHVTTNGTLIDRARWRNYAGRFGQVRVSIYEESRWRFAADVLSEAGQLWGANVLVDRARLEGLPALLAELYARGAHDVSLLSYVGPDRRRHLDAAGDRRLGAIVADSPIACRLSVCFGDRIAVPRLYAGDDPGDCGAGRDFVTITPDQRVQACSFQQSGEPATTAEAILAIWRTQRAMLAQPSCRLGCARACGGAAGVSLPPPIAVWQAFSGNNSGECFLVAKFREIADAEAYLAALLPDWTPNGAYSPPWQALFAGEGVLAEGVDSPYNEDASPRELLAIGRTVVAVQYGADDPFPELRALAWKRGAAVTSGGVHIHDGAILLFAARARDTTDRDRLAAAACLPGARAYPHGDVVLASAPMFGDSHGLIPLSELKQAVETWAGDRRFGIEIVFEPVEPTELLEAKKRLGVRPSTRPRLWVGYWGSDDRERAARFADTVGEDGRTTRAGGGVLIDPAPDRKRLAVLAYRHGGDVSALDGERVRVYASVWLETPPNEKKARNERRLIDRARFERFASDGFDRTDEVAVSWPEPEKYWSFPRLTITTDDPAAVLAKVERFATEENARVNFGIAELDPVGAALRRLVDDLGAERALVQKPTPFTSRRH